MPLAAGTRLGPYEIRSVLGVGGMGEVYRARDATLNRDVAIKVLIASLAADPDRIARFQREAQLLAALNHPHIGSIYGFVESSIAPADSAREIVGALVMELVEFYGHDGQIMVTPFTVDGEAFRADKPRLWSEGRYMSRGPFDLHPDGERFAVAAPAQTREGARADHVTFVFNFFDELRRLAPAVTK